MSEEFRVDELARRAGVASTTVRLYQAKGLLAAPRLEGRTGWYGESHLNRLRLIGRLQDEGHSLAGIGDLLQQWEQGRSLDAVMGVESELTALLDVAHPVNLDAAEVLSRFPAGAMTPDLMRRAAALGLVELTDDSRVVISDRRFLDTGAELAQLGVPLDVVLDEWEALVAHTDVIAGRFVDVFEQHLAPDDWQNDLDTPQLEALAATLARLQAASRQVVVAALDASLANTGRERLAALVPTIEEP